MEGVRPEIHRDDIMRCYSGVGLIEGARKVVENLKKRGVLWQLFPLEWTSSWCYRKYAEG